MMSGAGSASKGRGIFVGMSDAYRELPDWQRVYRLLVYAKAPPEFASAAVSVNRALAAELVKWPPARRTVQLEKCFVKVLEALPERPVVRDIDVMFHPAYKVDVMKVLVSAYKRRPYSLIWPGGCSNGRLTYSEETYPDYRTYAVEAYDILCVI